jgi:hypothetical protein
MSHRRSAAWAAVLAMVVTACASTPSSSTPPSAAATSPATVAIDATAAATSTSTTSTTSTTTRTTSTTTTEPSTTTSTTTTSTTTTSTLPPPPMTSCTDVAHVSDSTGVYLWEAQYVDAAANTMGERYPSIGVERWIDDSSGGRSIVERTADWQTTALEAADAIRRSGFRGCWVVMIGTNDAAHVGSGASVSAEERILRLLYVFGDDPVLWVDAATARTGTGYRNDNMRAWNDTLYRIADERSNVEVLRWSEQVRAEWFTSDGIHMGTEGRIWRAAITAAALAERFPR